MGTTGVFAPISPSRDSSRHHIRAPLFDYLRFTAEKKKKGLEGKEGKKIKLIAQSGQHTRASLDQNINWGTGWKRMATQKK